MSTARSPRSWSGSGVTTLYTTETRELFARNIEVPITGLSAATQNIILLRHIEHRAAMLRVHGDPEGPRRRLRRPDARAADHRRTASGCWNVCAGVRRGLRRRRSSDRAADRRPRNSAPWEPKRSILIVDDEFGLAEMLRDMLRELGYDVVLAINGRLALDVLQRTNGRPRHHRHDDAGDGRGRARRPPCAAARRIATSRS